MKPLIIAIDGPAASGKSTTAKLVAKRLGYLHVDTGAMYRAMTLKVIEAGIDPDSAEKISALAKSTRIRLVSKDGENRIELDGADVTEKIRTSEVTKAVSAVSMVPEVRQLMVHEQREMGKRGAIVLEGRDIGTVVFPNADVKVYMVANPRERAVRRSKELAAKGIAKEVDELEREIAERDVKDSTRAISPLTKAADAVTLDTTDLSIEEQVEFIVQKAKEKLS